MQFLIALDQLINTLFGGWADETISSRAWRQRHKRRWSIAVKLIDWIFFWDPNHCENAYYAEIRRRQVHDSMRWPPQ